MNKKGFLLRHFVVVMLLFSTLCGLGFLMVSDLSTEYDNTDIIDPNFNNTYNLLSNTTQNVDEMLEEVGSGEGLSFITGTAYLAYRSVTSVIQLVFASFVVVGSQVAGFSEDFGVPSTVANLILPMFLAILTTLIIFVVLSAVFRGKL